MIFKNENRKTILKIVSHKFLENSLPKHYHLLPTDLYMNQRLSSHVCMKQIVGYFRNVRGYVNRTHYVIEMKYL